MLDLTADLDYDAVGGLTLGADPVATAMLHAAAARGRALDAFVVRKEGKAHGLQRRIEGPDVAGRRVLAVEDTSTTGGSVLTAVEALREAGAEVVGVAVIVERGAAPADRGRRAALPRRLLAGRPRARLTRWQGSGDSVLLRSPRRVGLGLVAIVVVAGIVRAEPAPRGDVQLRDASAAGRYLAPTTRWSSGGPVRPSASGSPGTRATSSRGPGAVARSSASTTATSPRAAAATTAATTTHHYGVLATDVPAYLPRVEVAPETWGPRIVSGSG